MPGTGASPQAEGQPSLYSSALKLLTSLPPRVMPGNIGTSKRLTIFLGLTIMIVAKPFFFLNLKCWGGHAPKDREGSTDRDPLPLQYFLSARTG